MKLRLLPMDFAVCKLDSLDGVNLAAEYTFLARTDDEISLVCQQRMVPESAVQAEHGWQGLKICGMLDFGLVGIIAKLSGLLAKAEIPVFVVSTYNTDYIFVKTNNMPRTLRIIESNGCEIDTA